ncbi:MAG TPA: Lrp/AsnC family transcriptional regulator [Novosphingobium sp.]|nr:Lrp/AsnC family transcriptional regulator [Novosphingobium sp.]
MTDKDTRPKITPADRAIINALARDPQVSNAALSKELGLSETAVANRIDRLVTSRQMKVTVQRDIRTLGYTMMGIVEVSIDEEAADVMTIGSELGKIAEVLAVNVLPDRPQLVLIIVSADMAHFVRIVEQQIAGVAGVAKCSADVCLEILKFAPGLAAL